jgi:hypothetical protein
MGSGGGNSAKLMKNAILRISIEVIKNGDRAVPHRTAEGYMAHGEPDNSGVRLTGITESITMDFAHRHADTISKVANVIRKHIMAESGCGDVMSNHNTKRRIELDAICRNLGCRIRELESSAEPDFLIAYVC